MFALAPRLTAIHLCLRSLTFRGQTQTPCTMLLLQGVITVFSPSSSAALLVVSSRVVVMTSLPFCTVTASGLNPATSPERGMPRMR